MSTIAAIATGNAPAGIGVIRISGEDAVNIADKVFRCADGSSLSALGGYRAKFGTLLLGEDSADNAVALVFRAPKSYTGEDVAELSVHGGLLVLQKTLRAVLAAGAQPAAAGEFTKRAFLNGKLDLTQAESIAQIISAEGEMQLRASVSALQGTLSRQINTVLDTLLDCSASMAAWVDYPDEEIPELGESELRTALLSCADTLAQLLDGYARGQTATRGVDTVIAGRPNVGKSSLMNMLSQTDKSIVTHIEGTTRDIVEDSVTLGGIVLHLKDTAGLRTSGDVVEAIGIEKAYRALEGAQLILAVFDAAQALTQEDADLIEKCRGRKAIAVINKTDLPVQTDCKRIEAAFEKTVYISAKHDEGTAALEEAVHAVLGTADFDSSAPLLANERQKKNCENAHQSVMEALDGLAAGVTYDALGVMIDSAADELLSLTGKKATAEVVNNIFSKFCVGK